MRRDNKNVSSLAEGRDFGRVSRKSRKTHQFVIKSLHAAVLCGDCWVQTCHTIQCSCCLFGIWVSRGTAYKETKFSLFQEPLSLGGTEVIAVSKRRTLLRRAIQDVIPMYSSETGDTI